MRYHLLPLLHPTPARLLFTYGGFDPEDPITEKVTPAWVRFLDNLVAVAEAGTANSSVRN